jgi:hypothetical protein
MKTTAKLNPQTRTITLEIDEAELDSILQCAEIGIRKFYCDRIAKASTESQKSAFVRLEQNALTNLTELTETIAQA